MKKITAGITAHVDSGKTTLSEALLYISGEIRKTGRVDHGDSYLDTDTIEKNRGITIFSHQAKFNSGDTVVNLIDTPGHVDFSCETERTMAVLDMAVLVISGTDGVQSHTVTLWKLLKKYNIPTFIFVNKLDLNGADKEMVIEDMKAHLSPYCVDFSDRETMLEGVAECEESLMDKYFSGEDISDSEIAEVIFERKVFPCFFGSALKQEGVEKLLDAFDRFTVENKKPSDFGARIYKVSTDKKGNRLTYLKITGGELRVRQEITYTDADGIENKEKINSIRFYSGEKFDSAEFASAGDVCAVTGLTKAYSGQGLGFETDSPQAVLEPVMSYNAVIPDSVNIFDALKNFRTLEEEDPMLRVIYNEQQKKIHIALMGEIQLEVIKQSFPERFGYQVDFDTGVITYKETICDVVEGVGHYEPLCHYAEVHLILEPLDRGSGLQFELRCREDDLDRNWQRLILTHLEEKTHIGVLTGSPITDMKIIVASGKAHLKHTEGGDFRQATYRAVRNGLRKSKSLLLEPFYSFELTVPTENVGRAMTDIMQMSGSFSQPESLGEMSLITGKAPVSCMNSYQNEVVSYTKGKGRLILSVCGYEECHNADEVISQTGYNCDEDIQNSADSVFCSHGAGFNVKWDKVAEYMHLPSALEKLKEKSEERILSYKRAEDFVSRAVEDSELMEIFERTYGKIDRDPRKAFKTVKKPVTYKRSDAMKKSGEEYLLVDGYNIIFAWDDLKEIAKDNLDTARSRLCHILMNYQGYRGCKLIVVFDAYRVKGSHREVEEMHNITVVYTKEKETADTYIERVSHQLGKKHKVRVATSDGLEQIIILGNGAERVSAREFHEEVKLAEKSIREYIEQNFK
ncbi:MAG: TetM/TetW/TetO/TetS family tetracycline resistance ribosomal protection protein [Oscillospiraceae bacterium]|nr:TetM/TetW/TetO/TetS family tetracycline resistance ribosomal protection protein [Oscillospiraceae bacterium]